VIRARALARPGLAEGQALAADATLHMLARQISTDPRPLIPVAEADGRVVGLMDRAAALDILFGAGT
jgi:glycine betaine/proline transport system ATP-binding protein